MTTPIINENKSLSEFAEKAYLDYSMYVILDRALPQLGDGLKPVQRRIIYAMEDLGLHHDAKHKKSARTVGDVLGKFHPHSDSACYEAMVLMAQPFSYRYPLVDGQGNWGSQDDPKSFAAMRYTEARLSAYARSLLQEIPFGTINWQANFDGTLEEPIFLPARLPNLLLNGTTGIAVGMATDIPPHNLREVVNALVYLLEYPDSDLEQIMQFIPGPDFPTAAELITPAQEIKKVYETGLGSVKLRAHYFIEDQYLVIDALPYQVSGAKVIEQIAQQMQAKKLPMLVDLRDESDHENPTRIVLEPRSSRVDYDMIMSHLFATTDLEKSYRINLNLIDLDGRPKVLGLKAILLQWLNFRVQTVRRRIQFQLDKISHRLHILQGLLIAYLNIDEVIRIIRESDEPKAELIQHFNLSEIQAEAILNIKLRQLAKLEEITIKKEQSDLSAEQAELQYLLDTPSALKIKIAEELKEDAAKLGDTRRSPIIARAEAQAIKEENLIPSEPMTVILSSKGWIRAAKGFDFDVSTLLYKTGDQYLCSAQARSQQLVALLDSSGRSYSLPVHSLPSARSQGEPLTGRLSPTAGSHFIGLCTGEPSQKVLICSDAGYGFITLLEELYCKNKAGKVLITLPENSKPLAPLSLSSTLEEYLAVFTNSGRLLIFPIKDLPELAKGKGNKIIHMPGSKLNPREEWVTHLALLNTSADIILESQNKKFTIKNVDVKNYIGERGQRGKMLPRGFQRLDAVYINHTSF